MLNVRALSKNFGGSNGIGKSLLDYFGKKDKVRIVSAVKDVNLDISEGETVGIVGESGCGKSTLARMIAGIIEPSEGQIFYQGTDINSYSYSDRAQALLDIQMIFQDPFSSLNPRVRVESAIARAPIYHNLITKSEASDYVATILSRVGLDPSIKSRLPHQFSGGQRQRIGIARALAVNPKVLVCDEAVAALDVSIQAQILNLFQDLQSKLGLTYIFISHDLGVISHLCDRVVVMYLGRVVESGRRDDIFQRPHHPYTKGLMQEVPRIRSGKRKYNGIPGEIPSPFNPPSGCPFHPRCAAAMPICKEKLPALKEVGASGHLSACHLDDMAWQ